MFLRPGSGVLFAFLVRFLLHSLLRIIDRFGFSSVSRGMTMYVLMSSFDKRSLEGFTSMTSGWLLLRGEVIAGDGYYASMKLWNSTELFIKF